RSRERTHFPLRLSVNPMPLNILESLDYIYVPAPDVDPAERFYTTLLGGSLRWRIRDGGVTVAAVQLSAGSPLILLASHLAPKATLLICRGGSRKSPRRQLLAAQWPERAEPFEIPQGPCLVFRDPAGQPLAIYERTRPFVERSFEGRFD